MPDFIAKGKDYTNDLHDVWLAVGDIVENGGEAQISVTRRSNGSLPLLRHWRFLMRDIAKIYQDNGVTMSIRSPNGGKYEREFDEHDAHELFTYYLMPVDPETGLRKSWSRDGRENMKPASTGERVHALEKLYAYAFERGWKLSRFANSEYERYQEVQNR